MQVLVVEDDAHNRDMMVRRFVRRGFDIGVAVDGPEALDLAVSARPNLILLDVLLPRMSGLEVAKKLQDTAETSHIPILAISSNEAMREASIAAGCRAFIVKPVDFTLLFALIESLGLRGSSVAS